ncbi:hypothetical protein BY996DRAFT_6426276 [Phakopsora pachyrhizi]|nr:hypothetical protein BY996DRAFT_6426276 [Phakopsora pachyrhizi]
MTLIQALCPLVFQSGKQSLLKKVGIPPGGIPISSKGWTNHNGVVSAQVETSKHSPRSQLRRAKAASTAQHTKHQLANPSALAKVIWANLNTVAVGSSSKEDDDYEDGGKDRHGNMAKTEDNKYCPLAKTTSLPSSGPTRRLPNPLQGASTTTMAGTKSASQSTSVMLVPPPTLPKATPPRVVV